SKQLVSNARKNADQIVAQAKSQADQLTADAKNEIERHRVSAQREVDDLTRQKESISTHLAQISQLLGTQMPGLSEALKPPQSRPAVAPAAPKAVAGPPPPAPRQESRPAPQAQAQAQAQAQPPANGPKQPVSAKVAKANDEEWWTE
ncbi:MAG TPA: cellulose-binding protein, partial [Streptosporangiaceae bacterium]|nr:cellulose-binding protein [Streptosporangiaceae bacterium]